MSPFKRKEKMSPHGFRVISAFSSNYPSGGRNIHGGDKFESERNYKISGEKGRIERLFKTFQDRLLKELKLHKISSIEKANEYLRDVFIPNFNRRFCRDPQEPKPAWRVIPGGINLESVFSIKEQRTVMADNTISWWSHVFQILPNKHKISFAKAKVVVEKRLDGSIHIKYMDQYLNFKELGCDEPKKIKANTLPLDNPPVGDIVSLYQG